MSRKDEIEKIIISSLLSDFNEYYPDCRCTLTSSMFSSLFYSCLYQNMVELYSKGEEVNILTLFDNYHYSRNDVISMIEDMEEWEFLSRKTRYNENQFLFSKTRFPKYTNIKFSDYVTRFIRLVYER